MIEIRIPEDDDAWRYEVLYDSAPADAAERLRVQCGPGCYHQLGRVLEDRDGILWWENADRLQHPDGTWWTNREAEAILDPSRYLYAGCAKCGAAYSWTLREAAPQLAKARHTDKAVAIRLPLNAVR